MEMLGRFCDWIAALPALLFALDDAHAWPAGWLANRNALLAGLLLTIHVVVAPLLFVLRLHVPKLAGHESSSTSTRTRRHSHRFTPCAFSIAWFAASGTP